MTDAAAVIKSFQALVAAEDGAVADAFLLASLYVCAIEKDSTPRTVLDDLFIALPEDTTWPDLRRALIASTE